MLIKRSAAHPNLPFLVIALTITFIALIHLRRQHEIRALSILSYRPVTVQGDSAPKSTPSSNEVQKQGKEVSILDFVRPAEYPGSKTIITGHTKNEDVGWIREVFIEPEYRLRIYSVDDPESGDLHTPQNKGHEAMPYLTYILTHYHNLSDINIFLHPHRYAWHMWDSLISDTAELLNHFNLDRVERLGYANLRCRWNPGCPAHIDTQSLDAGDDMPEQAIFANAFRELFGDEVAMPHMMGGACCSQFAVMRETIQNVPVERYQIMHDWILDTELNDGLSGRVFESLWQFLFIGEAVMCPREHACYCDSYGLCFGGEAQFAQFEWTRDRKNEIEGKAGRLRENLKEEEEKKEKITTPEEQSDHMKKIGLLQERISITTLEAQRLKTKYDTIIQKAYENGKDPDKRAKELHGK
ncbi:hypothetical protein SCAR479_00761 [Seiridium cardinale]|uniref:Uncharacterized protein n=1 Tax=Seiridium cardinale TaxID=138064 RepID=A0ABR2Y6S3_9PEZI